MKTLEINDSLVEQVVAAIVVRAKGFDNMMDANGYGNLSATPEQFAEWKHASEGLWQLVRSLG